MKKLLLLSFALLFFLVQGYGQTSKYEVRFNPVTCLYEAHMHVITSYTDPVFDITMGTSSFSIVLPASYPDVRITSVTPVNPPDAVWTDNTPLYAPPAAPGSDFHKFSASSGTFNSLEDLTAGSDVLLFTFSLPSSGCVDGVRMFVNYNWNPPQENPDPASGPGMGWSDFNNAFKTVLRDDYCYIGNIGTPVVLPKPDVTPSYSFKCSPTGALYLNADAVSGLGCSNTVNYLWTGPGGFSSTLQNPVVDPYITGTYTVTVTNSLGCSGSSSIDLTDPYVPLTVTATATPVSCNGVKDGTATAIPAGGIPPYSYSWNTEPEQTTVTAVGLAPGTYMVTVTDNDLCTATTEVTVGDVPPVSAPGIIVVNNCDGTSLLTATGYTGDLLWSTGETSESITVTTAEVYTVTQTVNGCTGPAGSAISSPKTTPFTPEVEVTDNCDGTSLLKVNWFTGDLLWSTGQTTESIVVSEAGTYSVTQTVYGCTSSAGIGIAAPKTTPPAPAVEVTDNCDGTSVLKATGYAGDLLWSNGEITESVIVTAAGTYTVTQTVDGCTSDPGSGTAAPKTTPAAPVITVDNQCGKSVLTATEFTGQLHWSTGETTVSITVPAAELYTVVQTVDGCTSDSGLATAEPKFIPIAPFVIVDNQCGMSVLTVTEFMGELHWSTGETTPSITVTAAGDYTVAQTVDGCISDPGSGTAAPKTIPAAPMVTVDNQCGQSVLTATGISGDLLWSAGEMTESITVTAAGTYTVTQTVDGCTSLPGSGTAAPKTIPAAPVITVDNQCGKSVLTATEFTGQLHWSTGETTPSITVTAGEYTVAQTVDGCTSDPGLATAEPKFIPIAPFVIVDNQCGMSVLTVTEFIGELLWSTGETTPSITVTGAGEYTVAQTVEGCTSDPGSGTAAPKTIPPAPVVKVANSCLGHTVLTVENYTGNLLWSTGETTASITVTAAGVYTVTETLDGCTGPEGSGTANPGALPPAPVVDVADNCDGTSVLTAKDYTGSLLWSTGETTASITVNTAGPYTVTQTADGCTSPAGSGIAAPKTTPLAPVVQVVDNCDGTSVLTASGSAGTLLWSNSATTPSITVTAAGTYTVTLTADGCTSPAGSGIAAPKTTPPAPVVQVVDNCTGTSVLTASGYTGTLLWSTGATAQSIEVTEMGIYTVTQTVDGCTSLPGSGSALPKAAPPAPMVKVENFCGYSVLTAEQYTGDLHWNTGATTPSITVTEKGTYRVTQTVNGCVSPEGTGGAAPVMTPPHEVGNAPTSGTAACLNKTGHPAVMPVIVDASGAVLTYTSLEVVGYGNDCDGRVTYTYKYIGCADLPYEWVYTWTVRDDVEPEWTFFPDDTEILAGVDCQYDASPEKTGTPSATDTDSCGGTVTVTHLPDVVSPGSVPGESIITRTWVATDNCGNKTPQRAQLITVKGGSAPPNLVLHDHCVFLSEYGRWTLNKLDKEQITAGSTGGCGTLTKLTFTFSPQSFNCYHAGKNVPVTVTAADEMGNMASGTVHVSVSDSISPAAVCKDVTVTLDNYNQAFIMPGMIDNGSYDNCSVTKFELDKQLFTILDAGKVVPVMLVVYDPSGNTGTCQANVTVNPKTPLETVVIVNQAPTIADVAEVKIVNEPLSLDIPLTNITPGADQSQKVVSVSAVCDNPALVTNLEVIYNPGDANGKLKVIIAPSKSGSTIVTLTVKDNGGTDNGGVDTTVMTFRISVENSGSSVNVTVVDGAGNTAITSSVLNVGEEFMAKLWPNPTSGKVNIELNWSDVKDVNISVHNVLGVMVFSRHFSSGEMLQFDLSGRATGVYMVKINAEGKTLVKKVTLDRR